MSFKAEINTQEPGFTDLCIQKHDTIYLDRALVCEKNKKIFLLTTYENAADRCDYVDYVRNVVKQFVGDHEWELSINYIPSFFGCDFDDVVQSMDTFILKLKDDNR